MVSPANTTAIARLRREASTKLLAATDATPKYAPCGSPDRKRSASTPPNDGTSAVATLPTASAAASPINRPLRGRCEVNAVTSGAPTTTPRAYAEIR